MKTNQTYGLWDSSFDWVTGGEPMATLTLTSRTARKLTMDDGTEWVEKTGRQWGVQDTLLFVTPLDRKVPTSLPLQQRLALALDSYVTGWNNVAGARVDLVNALLQASSEAE